MIDQNVITLMRHVDNENSESERACNTAALAAGYTAAQAEACDDGEHKCPTCPWQKKVSA